MQAARKTTEGIYNAFNVYRAALISCEWLLAVTVQAWVCIPGRGVDGSVPSIIACTHQHEFC